MPFIKLPVSFASQRRLKLRQKEAQERLDAARSIVIHELFILDCLRFCKMPF